MAVAAGGALAAALAPTFWWHREQRPVGMEKLVQRCPWHPKWRTELPHEHRRSLFAAGGIGDERGLAAALPF